MNFYNTQCMYVNTPVGCTDPRCPRMHPYGYLTRCILGTRCKNQWCPWYHQSVSLIFIFSPKEFQHLPFRCKSKKFS